MTLFLLDNSVQQRLGRSSRVSAAVQSLIGHGDLLASSDVSRLEAGFSARSADDHREVINGLTNATVLLPLTPEIGSVAVTLQTALFSVGQGRAVGVFDLLHAATAIAADAVLVHYDHDFEIVADVDDRLRQQWVVPRGSID